MKYTDDVPFQEWMDQLDRIVLDQYGMSINDLPDALYRDAYDDGLTPMQWFTDNLGDEDSLRDAVFG